MSGPVLLVHDDIGTIAAVRRVLTRAGHEVVLATSAADALIAYGHHLPALLVLGPAVESGRGKVVLDELAQHPNGADARVLLLGEQVEGYSYPVVPLPLDGASFLELFESALTTPVAAPAPSLEDTLFGDMPQEEASSEQRANAAVELALEQAHQEFEAEAVASLDASLARTQDADAPPADEEWDPFGGTGEVSDGPATPEDDELLNLEAEVREEAARRRQARMSRQVVIDVPSADSVSPNSDFQAGSELGSDPYSAPTVDQDNDWSEGAAEMQTAAEEPTAPPRDSELDFGDLNASEQELEERAERSLRVRLEAQDEAAAQSDREAREAAARSELAALEAESQREAAAAAEADETRAREATRRQALLDAQRDAAAARQKLQELRAERESDGASIQLESDVLLQQKQQEWAEREERIRQIEAQRREALLKAEQEAEAARALAEQAAAEAAEYATDADVQPVDESGWTATSTATADDGWNEATVPSADATGGWSVERAEDGGGPFHAPAVTEEGVVSPSDSEEAQEARQDPAADSGESSSLSQRSEDSPPAGERLEVPYSATAGEQSEAGTAAEGLGGHSDSAEPLNEASEPSADSSPWNEDADASAETVGALSEPSAQAVEVATDSAAWNESAEPSPQAFEAGSDPAPWDANPDPSAETLEAGTDSAAWSESAEPSAETLEAGTDSAAWSESAEPSADTLEAGTVSGAWNKSAEPAAEAAAAGIDSGAWNESAEPTAEAVAASTDPGAWNEIAEPLAEPPEAGTDSTAWNESAEPLLESLEARTDSAASSESGEEPLAQVAGFPVESSHGSSEAAGWNAAAESTEQPDASAASSDDDITLVDEAPVASDLTQEQSSAEAVATAHAREVEAEEDAAARAEVELRTVTARGQVANAAAARALAMARAAQRDAEEEAHRQAEAELRAREDEARAQAERLEERRRAEELEAQALREREERERLAAELEAVARHEREERARIAAELEAQLVQERHEKELLARVAEERARHEREEGQRIAREKEHAARVAEAERERLAQELRAREDAERLEREEREKEARILAEHAKQEREARERVERELQAQLELERLEKERVARELEEHAQREREEKKKVLAELKERSRREKEERERLSTELETVREAAKQSEERAQQALRQIDAEKHSREELDKVRIEAQADAERARAEAREMAARAEAALIAIPKEQGVIERIPRTGIAPLEKLAEIIRELTFARVDVRLELKADDALRVLWLRSGGIAGALSSAAGETLLDRARQDGLIDPAQLRTLSPYKSRSALDQLAALREHGLLRESEVIPLVQRYTEAVALSAFSEAGSLYRLATETVPADVPLAASTRPVIHLLAEGLRRGADPASAISAVGGLRAIPVRKRSELEPGRLELNDRERRLLDHVDGSATIEQLLLGSGLRQDAALRLLVVARALGLLELMPASEPSPAEPLPELEVQRLEAKLSEIREADYFAVLGLPRSAGKDEVLRAYELLSTEFHPLRFSTHPDPSVPRRAEELQGFLSEAVTALGDDRLRGQYARNLAD